MHQNVECYVSGDEGAEQLYLIRNKISNEEVYLDGCGIMPPVRISADGKTVTYPELVDYGYVVNVRRAFVSKKGEITFDKYPVFGTPWPVLSITSQKSGSLGEVTSMTDETENGDDSGDNFYDDGESAGPDDDGMDIEPSGGQSIPSASDDDIDI